MDPEKFAFWGITLQPGEPADLQLTDGETLHVTNASLGEELVDVNGRSVISTSFVDHPEDGEDVDDTLEKTSDGGVRKKYALCVLNAGRNETCVLDVSFVGDEIITIEVSGKNVVHLVGSFSYDGDDEDEDEEDEEGNDLIGVYDDDDDNEEDEMLDDKTPDTRLLLSKQDAPVITELDDDDNGEEEEEKAKGAKKVDKKEANKNKTPNGKAVTPSPAKDGKATKKDNNENAGAGGKNAQKGKGAQQKGGNKNANKQNTPKKADKPGKDADDDDVMKDVDDVEAKPTEKSKADADKPKVANGDAKKNANESNTPSKGSKKKRKLSIKGDEANAGGANGSDATPTAKKQKAAGRPGTPTAVKKDETKKDGAGKKEGGTPKGSTPTTPIKDGAGAKKGEDQASSANNTPNSAKKRKKKGKRASKGGPNDTNES